MEHKEAAICILQGVEHIEFSIGSMMKHLYHFKTMGYVSDEEFENVSKVSIKVMDELISELTEPELKLHPELITQCTSCSMDENIQNS